MITFIATTPTSSYKPCFDLNGMNLNPEIPASIITGEVVEYFTFNEVTYWTVQVENYGCPYVMISSDQWKIQNMEIYIRKHPSGGYIVDFPDSAQHFYDALTLFFLWRNDPNRKGYVGMEFVTHDMSIEAFENFITYITKSLLPDAVVKRI